MLESPLPIIKVFLAFEDLCDLGAGSNQPNVFPIAARNLYHI